MRTDFRSRLVASFAAALPLLALPLSAQVSGTRVNPAACPVTIMASYMPGAALRPITPVSAASGLTTTRSTAASASPAAPATTAERRALHLSFGPAPAPGEEAITSASFTVSGIDERGGILLTSTSAPVATQARDAGKPGSPMIEHSYTIRVAANPAGLQSGIAWLTGFGGIRQVRIDSLTYSSGRTWSPKANSTCEAYTGSVLRSAR